MNYIGLKTIYYKDREEYERVYHKRFSEGVKLGLEVNNNQAFYVEDIDIFKTIVKIHEVNEELIPLVEALPGIARKQYTDKCLIDEIVLTNDIEGVHSTRRELGEILSDLGKTDKTSKFYGLVKEYAALQESRNLSFLSSQDVRDVYDILFLDEVKNEDPEDVPDGKIFRAGPVSVIKATQKEIHKGLLPEEKIIDYMDKSLELINDDAVDILIRVSIFHYLFGYIHPFYEANGRMSRFISSCILSNKLVYLIGYRLSYCLKEHITEYYRAFEDCNDSKNKGDLTPFIHMFTSIILEACVQLRDELKELNDRYKSYIDSILKISEDKKIIDILFYLLQAALFSDIGISTAELLELTKVTRATLQKRLKSVEQLDLLVVNQRGTNKFYMLNLDNIEL